MAVPGRISAGLGGPVKSGFTSRDSRTAANSSLSCPKKFLNEIGRPDLIDFTGCPRKQPPKLQKDGTPRKPLRSGDLQQFNCGLRLITPPAVGGRDADVALRCGVP